MMEIQPVVARTSAVDLVELIADHFAPLHQLAMQPSAGRRWRTRGRFISPHAWGTFLMSGADWQLVGVDRLNSRVLGLAELSDLQLLDGHGQLSVLTSPAYWRTGLPIEFVSAFILEVFERFPLQKLYATVASVPQDPLGSLGERFTVEGHLRDYIRVDGVLRDAMIVAIERSAVLRQLERAGAIARVGDHSAVESGGLDGALPTSSAAALCAEWADRLEMTAGELLDVPMHALDSLDVLELVSVLEEQRGCAIAWEALAELQTVGEILGFAG